MTESPYVSPVDLPKYKDILRDEFARTALEAIMRGQHTLPKVINDMELLSQFSWMLADAMMKERDSE